MGVSYPTKIFLSMKSGNVCAFKECRKALTPDGVKSNPAIISEASLGFHFELAKKMEGTEG